jgi:hypothetical protein
MLYWALIQRETTTVTFRPRIRNANFVLLVALLTVPGIVFGQSTKDRLLEIQRDVACGLRDSKH